MEGAVAAQAPSKVVEGDLAAQALRQLVGGAVAAQALKQLVGGAQAAQDHREIRHVDTRPLDSIILRAYKRGWPKS